MMESVPDFTTVTQYLEKTSAIVAFRFKFYRPRSEMTALALASVISAAIGKDDARIYTRSNQGAC
jgi:hypothetical protein